MASNDMLSALLKLTADSNLQPLNLNSAKKSSQLSSRVFNNSVNRNSKMVKKMASSAVDSSYKSLNESQYAIIKEYHQIQDESFWVDVQVDDRKRIVYENIESDFEFKVVVLGDAKVGKTSLIQSIVTGSANLVHTTESDPMYTMLNMRKSVAIKEFHKHNIELKDGSKHRAIIHDTQNSRSTSSIS